MSWFWPCSGYQLWWGFGCGKLEINLNVLENVEELQKSLASESITTTCLVFVTSQNTRKPFENEVSYDSNNTGQTSCLTDQRSNRLVYYSGAELHWSLTVALRNVISNNRSCNFQTCVARHLVTIMADFLTDTDSKMRLLLLRVMFYLPNYHVKFLRKPVLQIQMNVLFLITKLKWCAVWFSAKYESQLANLNSAVL